MSIDESCQRLLNSIDKLELVLLRKWYAEEKKERRALEVQTKDLTSKISQLEYELTFSPAEPFEHDAHSEGRSHLYRPDPRKNPRII